MPTISIRMRVEEFEELNQHSKALDIPRAEYVRQALLAMNKQLDRDLRKKRIFAASRKVRAESMRVNAEFDVIEDAPDV